MNCFVTRRGGEHKWSVFGITPNAPFQFGQNLAWTTTNPINKMAAGGQRSEIGQILPRKSHFGWSFGSRSSDLDNI